MELLSSGLASLPRDDGGPVTGRHALVRALIAYVEVYLGASKGRIRMMQSAGALSWIVKVKPVIGSSALSG